MLEWCPCDDREDEVESHRVWAAYRDGANHHPVAEIHFNNYDEDYMLFTYKVEKKVEYEHGDKIETRKVGAKRNCGSFKTDHEAKKEAEDVVAMMYGEERPGYTYVGHDDFYGYIPYYFDKDGKPTCYYIESRDGTMLIGDGLPSTEEQAKAYCRCANIAHRHARRQ
jgi:hypothetical protein